MSEENVETLKASIAAWNERDMDALRELHDPHVVVRMVEGWPESGPFMGRDAVMRQFEQLRDTWDADAVVPIGDFIDVGDRVLVRMIYRGMGQALRLTSR
jgi:ketosteroid isomerase-like protein